eukprot:XP_006248025.1 PREDICTED: uncharacterized protein LOC102551433 [Rattus norvegicus]
MAMLQGGAWGTPFCQCTSGAERREASPGASGGTRARPDASRCVPAPCTGRWTGWSRSPTLPPCTKAQDSGVLVAGSLWRPEAAAQRLAWRAGATAALSTDLGWLNEETRNTGSGAPLELGRGVGEDLDSSFPVNLAFTLTTGDAHREWHPLSEGCWWVPDWRLTVGTQSGPSLRPKKGPVLTPTWSCSPDPCSESPEALEPGLESQPGSAAIQKKKEAWVCGWLAPNGRL